MKLNTLFFVPCFSVMALSGCCHKEKDPEQIAALEELCKNQGYESGTKEYTHCLKNEELYQRVESEEKILQDLRDTEKSDRAPV